VGNSFKYYLLIYHTSCAIVSVFWLRWEIVFGCTVSKKDSYLVSLIDKESARKCVYFVRSNTLLHYISLLCIYLLYRTVPQTHRLDCFWKFPELSGQVGISRIPWKNADRKMGNLSKIHHPISPLSGPHSWLYLPTNLTRKMLLHEPHWKGFKWQYPWSSWKLIFEIVACQIRFFEIRIRFFWYP
jgi:hypothetical protein